MSDREIRRRPGFSGFTLLLGFASGALAGAAIAYLAQAENRAKVRELALRARSRAARIPEALHDASSAAHDAFAQKYDGDNGQHHPAKARHQADR